MSLEGVEMNLGDKNILVTGGSGLIGSHVVDKLLGIGARVFVLTRGMRNAGFLKNKINHKNLTWCYGDVRDGDRIEEILEVHNVDVVFHLGAQSQVRVALVNPRGTLETNINGTVNVLEASRRYGKIQAVLIASSDKAYGAVTKKFYREEDPLRGEFPYEVSKSCVDLIARAYFVTYDLPVAVLRCGNVYGEGDANIDRLIPGLVKSIVEKKEFLIRSDGKHVRDFVYVEDAADAYLELAKNIERIKGEAFNLSSGDCYSVLDLIRLIEKKMGIKVRYKVLNIAHKEILFQSLNADKIRKVIGFTARYSLDQKIKGVFEWYEDYFR